jgi:hypothetical protein
VYRVGRRRGYAQHTEQRAVATNTWPDPLVWMMTLHYAFHSFPMLFFGTAIARSISGRWPPKEVTAWALHVLIDVPARCVFLQRQRPRR